MAVTIHLKFEGDLAALLSRTDRSQPVVRRFPAWTRIRRVIESCGIPATEVDLIVVDSQPAGFDTFICEDAHVTLLPPHLAPSVFPDFRLQQAKQERFVADGKLGHLTRNLRLLGVDVRYSLNASSDELIRMMDTPDRALLSRDCAVLMRSEIVSGYCPRSENAEQQTLEVVRRFGLTPQPYTRCPRCNGLLDSIDMADAEDLSITVPHHQQADLRRCATCQNLYASGTQARQLEATIRRGLAE